MADTTKELDNCRKRWLEATKRKDFVMASLWERIGKAIKKKLFNGEEK